MSHNDNVVAELKKIRSERDKQLLVGRQYYVVDWRECNPVPIGIRIRAFKVTDNGSQRDTLEGDLAVDVGDMGDVYWINVAEEDREEAVRLMKAGTWSVKCERSKWDLYDTPEEAREAAGYHIEMQRSELEEAWEKLRSLEKALEKWDGVLCVPHSHSEPAG